MILPLDERSTLYVGGHRTRRAFNALRENATPFHIPGRAFSAFLDPIEGTDLRRLVPPVAEFAIVADEPLWIGEGDRAAGYTAVYGSLSGTTWTLFAEFALASGQTVVVMGETDFQRNTWNPYCTGDEAHLGAAQVAIIVAMKIAIGFIVFLHYRGVFCRQIPDPYRPASRPERRRLHYNEDVRHYRAGLASARMTFERAIQIGAQHALLRDEHDVSGHERYCWRSHKIVQVRRYQRTMNRHLTLVERLGIEEPEG